MSSSNCNIKVSVVVTVYGVERYIRRFAESLFSQSYKNIEFIIVNDGSKDSSMEILSECLSSFPQELQSRVKIFNNENMGLAKARVFAINQATGDYIIAVDADDWMDETMIEKLVAAAPGHDFIYCDFYFVRDGKANPYSAKDYDVKKKTQWMDDVLRWSSYSFMWDAMFSAKLVKQNSLITPICDMNEDTFLYFQLLQRAQSIAHVREPLYYYRISSQSMTNSRERRKVKHVETARNFLQIRDICIKNRWDILSRETSDYIVKFCGWKALKYDRRIFDEFPELTKTIISLGVSRKYRHPLPKQILLHIYAKCRNTHT